jgi:hypothetical protein
MCYESLKSFNIFIWIGFAGAVESCEQSDQKDERASAELGVEEPR